MSVPRTFPWPFAPGEDSFAYSVNVEPALHAVTTPVGRWGERTFDIPDDYVDLMSQRRRTLDRDPRRFGAMPHMTAASWDLVLVVLSTLAAENPEWARLDVDGDAVHWRNDLLGIDDVFVLGQDDTLPEHPLVYVGCQVPDDLLLVSEHEDGHLYFDAGLVTFAGAWSVGFDVGMSMHEIHGPVPDFTGRGLTDRIERFIASIGVGAVYRRVNWSVSDSASDRLDTSLETAPEWSGDLDDVLAGGDWGRLRLRLELEHFIRLPLTGALVFSIRTYLATLDDLAEVPEWSAQLARIVRSVPEPVARYKGIAAFRDDAMAWLERAAGAVPSTSAAG